MRYLPELSRISPTTDDRFIRKITVPPTSLSIDCETIKFTAKDAEITIDVDRQIKDFDIITINGVTFKRVEE